MTTDATDTPLALLDLVIRSGAEIEVRDPEEHPFAHLALARAWRVEGNTLYVRPLRNSVDIEGDPVFSMNANGVQHLAFERVDALAGGQVGFLLDDGYAVVRAVTDGPSVWTAAGAAPSGHDRPAMLRRWDAFHGELLDSTEQQEADALLPGSWIGRYE